MTQRIATAEWADPEEFAAAHKFKTGDFWLGRSIAGAGVPLGYDDDRHVCLVSGSRGGKGTTCIVNNLCLWPGSLVVVDPKGENATITARRRGAGSPNCDGLGQEVHVLDPFGETQLEDSYRSCFNPLDALDSAKEETVDEASRIADALVVVQNEKDRSWEERARDMIRALILHVLTAPEYEGERNLVTVRQLIMRGDWKAEAHLRQNGMTEKEIPPAQSLLWDNVQRNPAFAILAGIGARFLAMTINAPQQFEGVIDAAVSNTEFIDSPGMKRCLEKSNFQLASLKTNPKGLSLYLCLPQRYMTTHHRWLRMMVALTVTEMEFTKGRPACGHRVLMCLDEFAGLERMKVMEHAVAQIAGSGVKLFFVLQSLEQLKAAYERTWETFLSNSGLKIFFNLEDHFSREYVSKFIGETEVIRETRSTQQSTAVSHQTTKGETTERGTTTGRGGSTGTGWNKGTTDGSNWKANSLVFRNTARFFSLFRDGETMNRGSSIGTSGQQERNWQRGTSESRGTQTSETEGTTETTGGGTSEGIHKRPLITPDEIGLHFSRIADAKHPAHPGFGLVLISGQRPAVVRRINYYEEPIIKHRFDPSPEHKFDADRTQRLESPTTRHWVNSFVTIPGKANDDWSSLVEWDETVRFVCPAECFYDEAKHTGFFSWLSYFFLRKDYDFLRAITAHNRLLLTNRRFILVVSQRSGRNQFVGTFMVKSIPYSCVYEISRLLKKSATQRSCGSS
jgi:type IV secretory pathway TraG/TraD family ATPase VirD4